jgi:hypothetical protein
MNLQALEFYQNNKDCTWSMEPIPSHLKTDLEIASWVLNTSKFGWLELDLTIDTTSWQLEAHRAKSHFVAHREDNNTGWNSCCIHGIDIEKTGAWTNYGYSNEKDVPYKWTDLADTSPVIKKFWQHDFPADSYRRIRYMELEPFSAITPHSDMPGRLPGEDNFNALEFGVPVNIAVAHPEDCYMVLQGHGIVPFKEGKAFIVNIRNYHSVINFSQQPRIHVIGHPFGYGSNKEKFAELITRSYTKQYEHSRI